MSGIGGVYHFNGQRVEERTLGALSEGLRQRGPDGGDTVTSGSVGMVYRAFHTTKESRLENQPLTSADGCILAWDGRLDNRKDLQRGLHEELNGNCTDVGLVLASYRKWGSDFLSRLVGDYALSLWDPRVNTLLLARDPFGPRPLYYHVDRERVLWSSAVGSVASLAEIELEVDEEYVAGFVTTGPEPARTPYKGIHAVPPGKVASVRNGHIEERRFWRLDPNYEIRYRNDSEYEEHFRDLFRESVRCRLRSEGPVWSELSGGLDSSSIVCMADEILTNGEAQASDLETVSYVYDEASSSDERDYIHCVEEKRGRRGYHIREDDHRVLAGLTEEPFHWTPSPLDCFARQYRELCGGMQKGGARVLLRGECGDHLLWSEVPGCPPDLADLVLQLRPFSLHRRIRAWSELEKTYWELLWKGALGPLLPQRIRPCSLPLPDFDSLFERKFIKRMNLRERMLGVPDEFGFRLPSRRDQSSMLLNGIWSIAAGYYEERGSIEINYPYLHRPLVEFLVAIPIDQKLRPGETRSLHRRAFRELLPEKISRRQDKKGPDEALYRAVVREWPRLNKLLAGARVSSQGYVKPGGLKAVLKKAKHGVVVPMPIVLRAVSLELWLRGMEHRVAIHTVNPGSNQLPSEPVGVTPEGRPQTPQVRLSKF